MTVLPFKAAPTKDQTTGRFLTGNNGGGRPKGARNKLGESFVADMLADWEAHGADAIARVRRADPGVYLKIIASMLPRHVGLDDANPIAGLPNEQLERLIAKLRACSPSDTPRAGLTDQRRKLVTLLHNRSLAPRRRAGSRFVPLV